MAEDHRDAVARVRVDLATALRRLDGDEALLRDMIDYFREDCPVLLATMKATLADGKSEEFARAAHSLKGLVASFGSDSVVDRLEAIQHEPLAAARHTLAGLELELDRLNDLLDGSA